MTLKPTLSWLARLCRCSVILVLLWIGAGTPAAWALTCSTFSNETEFVEPIGNLSVPDSVPDGSIIWISPTRTTSGVCKKHNDDAYLLALNDPISFYGLSPSEPRALYPGDPSTWGITISLRYQGREYPLSQMTGGIPTGFVLPPCNASDFYAGRCFINVSITYQIVIRKHGLSPFVRPRQDMLSLFQFDGALGINCCARSFQYVLSGLTNIGGTSCTVDVTVTPEPGIVDFGQIQTTGAGFEPAVPRKPFSLRMSKQCATRVKIGGYFQTSNPILNGLILPTANSNFGVRIEDANGRQLPLHEPFALMDFASDQMHANVQMSASLVALGAPKLGPFSATATVLVLYN